MKLDKNKRLLLISVLVVLIIGIAIVAFTRPQAEDSLFYGMNDMNDEDILEKFGEPTKIRLNDNSVDYVYNDYEFLKINGSLTIRCYSSGSLIYARWRVDGNDYNNKKEYSSDIEKVIKFFSKIYENTEASEDGTNIDWSNNFVDERVWFDRSSTWFELEYRPW